MDEETFNFNWHSFQTHILDTFQQQFKERSFSDVTLVTDDQGQFQAHRFVLSSCSPILKDLLLTNFHPHPLICLYGVKKRELECILQFMYLGETKIDHDRIDDFLNVVKNLKIKQLFRENMSHNDKYDMIVQSKEIKKGQDINNHEVESDDDIFRIKEETSINCSAGTEQDLVSEGQVVEDCKSQLLTSGSNALTASVTCTEQQITENKLAVKEEDENIEVSRNQNLDKTNEIQQGSTSCNNCEYETRSRDKLQKHQQALHEGIKYSCELCDFQSGWQHSIGGHIQSQHSDKNQARRKYSTKKFKCGLCDYIATKLIKIQRHMQKIHEENTVKFVCDVPECNYRSMKTEGIVFHQRKKHKLENNVFVTSVNSSKATTEANKCDDCEYVFKTKEGFLFHSRKNHKDLRYYSCDQCEYKALNRSHFRRHYATHNSLNIKCDQCLYTASSYQNLEKHQEAQHQGQVYTCDKCDFEAAHSSSIYRHKQIKHDGIRHQCDQCEYQSTAISDLKIHHRSKHEGIKFSCDKCEYKATFKKTLQSHKKAIHEGIQLFCDKCEYTAKFKVTLQKHKKDKHT